MYKYLSRLCFIMTMMASLIFLNPAQAQEGFEGDWAGVIAFTPDFSVTFLVDIRSEEDGSYYAVFNSSEPAAGLNDTRTSSVSVDGNTIILRFDFGMEYEGTLTDNVIEGEMFQAGMQFPLRLEKRAE